MKGKFTVSGTDVKKALFAAEITDTNVTGTKVVGKDVIIEANFKGIAAAIQLGRYIETLPADSAPTPKKEATAPTAKK